MHILPQLRKLEQKYSKELAVIGVHSAKFPTEQETENLRSALLRYEVGHPVINDHKFRVWQSYTCRAWPTLFFLDPVGRIIGKHEGEIPFDALDNLLGEMVREFDAQGLLDRTPLTYRLERTRAGGLSFPGKVLADDAASRLFIADSNHNRIVQTTLAGEVVRTIGGVTPGFEDGDFVLASFNHPQGLALDGETLYVADTENHAIRRVDLIEGYVETLAGTGQQGGYGFSGGPARTSPLNSPWDLALLKGVLYIAMAGAHQLWALELAKGDVGPYAGSGRENITDGPLADATLAQPSGITTDGQRLYFADSETSSIRIADASPYGRVTTIVGQGLFEFGDTDGIGTQVRLQHPLGICWHDGVLYVADTYNHKVKKVLPITKSAVTYLASGSRGLRDGVGRKAQFYEPSGLSVAAGKLYVADTNNHAIRVADLATGLVSTLEIRGL